MTSQLIANTGVDFDNLFLKGSGTQTLGIVTSYGVDIGDAYTAGNSTIATGFYGKDGSDVGYKLADGANLVRVYTGAWPFGSESGSGHEYVKSKAFEALDGYETNKSKFRDLAYTETIGASMGRHWRVAQALYVNSSVFKDIPGARVDMWISNSSQSPGADRGQFMLYTRRHTSVFLDAAVVGHGVAGYNYQWCDVKTVVNIPGVVYREYNTRFYVC